MRREQTLSPTDFYTLSPVINEQVTHFHRLNELKLPHKNSHSASPVFTCSTQTTHFVLPHVHTHTHTRKQSTKKGQKLFSRAINTRTHTPLTHYLEVSYSQSHRPLTGARPVFSGTRHPGSKASSVV